MTQFRKRSRVKTEGDKLAAEIQRQRSIFKNLSWQVKQKDRKIGFLQRYYQQLKNVIQKEKQDDEALVRRAGPNIRRKKEGKIYRSNILQKLYPSEQKRRVITEGYELLEEKSLISEQYLRSNKKK